MESPAMTRYIPRKSKTRVFPGSSSSCMEPEVIEISPPPSNRNSKSKAKAVKSSELVFHEIIDVDLDEDHHDVMLTGRKVESNEKWKDTMGISFGPSSEKFEPNNKGKDAIGPFPSVHSSAVQLDSEDVLRCSNKSFAPGSFNFFDLDETDLMNNMMASATPLAQSADPVHTWKNLSSMVEPPPLWPPSGPAINPENFVVWSSSSYSGVPSQSHATNVPSVETRRRGRLRNMPAKLGGSSSHNTYHQLGDLNIPGSSTQVGFFGAPEAVHIFPTEAEQAGKRQKRSSVVGSSSSMPGLENEDVLKKYENFKKFDTVEDYSDHYYSRQSSETKQPPKNWTKKIQEEWRILEKDLPDTIFVRAYESRMDLLRAVIIGAEGTPYHDGLFFFDVCFPSSYPASPPLVHYHSGGLRINPNLYNCGKVCLSLLNTWTGHQKERWTPGVSTMLQVLVSIQGLILNAKPYFNEPGYAHSSGSVHGEMSSLQYNENTLILSLKTMVYTMKKPPKNFEDLVIGHFHSRVRDILMACKAYTEGVQVGCIVRGGVQDVDEGDKSCSLKFKADVTSYVKTIVGAFKKIGAKEAEEFLSLSKKKTPPPVPVPFPPTAITSHHYYP